MHRSDWRPGDVRVSLDIENPTDRAPAYPCRRARERLSLGWTWAGFPGVGFALEHQSVGQPRPPAFRGTCVVVLLHCKVMLPQNDWPGEPQAAAIGSHCDALPEASIRGRRLGLRASAAD